MIPTAIACSDGNAFHVFHETAARFVLTLLATIGGLLETASNNRSHDLSLRSS